MLSLKFIKSNRLKKEMEEVSNAAVAFDALLAYAIQLSKAHSIEFEVDVNSEDDLNKSAIQKRLIGLSFWLDHLTLESGLSKSDLLKSIFILRREDLRVPLRRPDFLDFDEVHGLCMYFAKYGELMSKDDKETVSYLRKEEGLKMNYCLETYAATASELANVGKKYQSRFEAIEIKRKLGDLLQSQESLQEEINHILAEEKMRKRRLLDLSTSHQELKEKMKELLSEK